MRKRYLHGLSKMLFIGLLISLGALLPASVHGDEPDADYPDLGPILERYQQDDTVMTYDRYRMHYREAIGAGPETTISLKEMLTEGGDGTLEPQQSLTLTINIPETAVYYPSFNYQVVDDTILPARFSIEVDGEYTYDELKRLVVANRWMTPGGDTPIDRYGNEVMAMPLKSDAVLHTYLHAQEYLHSQPMGIFLEQGEHELVLHGQVGRIQLGDWTFRRSVEIGDMPPREAAEGDASIILEAEDMAWRNSPNIRPDSTYNTKVTPYSNDKKVLNHIADGSFRAAGDALTYVFDVEEAGWYQLAFKYRQNERADYPVFRNIYLDGSIPGRAFFNAAFPYAQDFVYRTLSDDEGPVTLYLDEGSHQLTLQATLDHERDAIRLVTCIVDEMSEMGLNISKVTGGNTDRFRDFRLEEFEFDIPGKLSTWIDDLKATREHLAQYASDRHAGALAELDVAISTLRTLSEEPDELPKELDAFVTGPGSARQSLTSFLESFYRSSLGLDKIVLYQEGAKLPPEMPVWKRMGHAVIRFFRSFRQQDYSAQNTGDKEALQVWVNRPRQYLEIMQRMVDTSFAPEHDTEVSLSLMPDQNRLILANASGTSPDVALSIQAGLTYDLAIRGVLTDMRQFDNFQTVAKRVPPGLLIPGIADEGLYAMPETFNFWMLFYRTDILDMMHLDVPETMDDVRRMLPQLQRRGMNFNSHVANFTGIKPFAATMPFIYQNGGELFDGQVQKLALDSEEVLRGMKMLTDNFTIYNMPYEVQNFYQSFRNGSVPIGVSDYGMLNLLTNAAPELKGKWAVTLYPGVENETGEVERWTLGSAESCIIFNASEKEDLAWSFIDWWTSEPTQTEFGYTLQSTLGNEYLWNSSNVETMKQTPWIQNHPDIMTQVQWIREPERVLGGYMIERELSNVVTSVVMEGNNLRSAMDEAVKTIDREVKRKLEEFGYLERGRVVRELAAPNLETVERWLEE